MTSNVCFLTAHLNPANHFAQYVQVLEDSGVPCKVLAGPSVHSKFSKAILLDVYKLGNEEFYQAVQKEIVSSTVVVTDIANERWADLHEKLAEDYPNIKRVAYYDNPESYVPGGYSELAAKVIAQAEVILFANQNLAKTGLYKEPDVSVELSEKTSVGVGYYPEKEAQKIASDRADQIKVAQIKASFFERHGITETNSKVLTYIGGANETYYEAAFPRFVEMLAELVENDPKGLENTTVILQQHPRAKREGSCDAKLALEELSHLSLPKGFHFVVSDLSTPDSMTICDAVLYYQTSMAAQFVLADIPVVLQVGHEPYPDLLVKTGFPSICESEKLIDALNPDKDAKSNSSVLKSELGMDSNWKENLKEALESND